MKKWILPLYALLALCLGTATVIEKYRGTDFVSTYIYSALWFTLLWGLLAALSAACLFKKKLYRRPGTFLLHLSLLVILAGAGITRFSGRQGIVHLRQGEAPAVSFLDEGTRSREALPFALSLDTFYVEFYPGTRAPADYVSRVYTNTDPRRQTISMNNIARIRGYRFYQTSFDEDYRGSWLSVNYDPVGIPVTYAGYALLALSALVLLLAPAGRFRKLLNHPLLRYTVLLLACLQTGTTLSAQEISLSEAEKYKTKQVIYNDRIVPFNTLARDFTIKLTGHATYKGQTAEQVMLGWLMFPDVWQNEPMIEIKNKELRRLLNCGPRARLTDLFEDGRTYKLQTYWNQLHQSGKQSSLLKAITEMDEKVAIINMLHQGTLIRPVPEDSTVRRLSDAKVKAEIWYNRIPFATILYRLNLTLGLLIFLIQTVRHPLLRRRPLRIAATAMMLASLAFYLAGTGMRTYISGRIPMSNGYETMTFMAGVIMLLALALRNKFPLALCFGFLLSGFTLLVADIGQMNPQITPLMPVLSSPLLSLHVSLIMISYALLSFLLLNAVAAFIYAWKKERTEVRRLTVLSRLLLYPATLLLGVGIFVGAVWANVSWGRYWSWDPKEVWALVTFMIYALAFHSHSLPAFRRPLFLHGFLLLAFTAVLMTYFGVNYILGGMHSYANA